MAITGIIMGSIVSAFIIQRRSYTRQEQITVMMQNVRAAMDMLVREVRMTGYGVPPTPLSSWIDWVAGFTTNPQITPGSGSDPDTLTIASAFDAAKLSLAANKGNTTLKLSAGGVKKFTNSKGKLSQAKKVVYIGRNEPGVITAISGNTLTIDTNPLVSGSQGLQGSYPVGTPVELLRVITYSIVDNTLKRNENTGAGAQPLAENIEDFEVTVSNNTLTLTLSGRTTNPDMHYTQGDSYRRIELSSRVRPRNLGL
jgi:hypothetical protein